MQWFGGQVACQSLLQGSASHIDKFITASRHDDIVAKVALTRKVNKKGHFEVLLGKKGNVVCTCTYSCC